MLPGWPGFECDGDHVPFPGVRRVRIDSLLSERGMFESRARAAAAVLAGEVLVLPERRRVEKPGQLVPVDVELAVAQPPPFVSRGGVKLANALDALDLDVSGALALDVGASTGGFTDCLLQRGAERVVAIDVGYGELAWRLREDLRVTVMERCNARGLTTEMLPYRPGVIVTDVSFISLTKVLPAVLACAAARFDCLALVKPQFEVGRGAVGKGGVVRSAGARRGALVDVGAVCGVAGRGGDGVRQLRLARAQGQPGDVRVAGRGGPARRRGGPGARSAGGGAVTPPRTATVFTHRRPAETAPALAELIRCARGTGTELRFSAAETEKHGFSAGEGVVLDAPVMPDVDICFALGGDGTILTALRTYAGTGVPVFAANFGEIGFLATVDQSEPGCGFERALAGDFEVLSLPGISMSEGRGRWLAINDVSIHRQPGLRVADLSYAVGPDEIGRVRCDGLVVATPAGSTGYNLANGGPVMAWGVEGYVVSFIAPHSLTARALVVAPGDQLMIENRSREEPVDVTVDGRPVCALAPGETVKAEFVRDQGRLAQLPGATFYQRLREKFGRLASG